MNEQLCLFFVTDPPVGTKPRHEWDDCIGRGLNPRPTPSLLPVACCLLPLKAIATPNQLHEDM
ncbi:MAG: hypothetical protein QNJ51_11695 [Calothrix sp. MO_167.B12]|nr:hypothetical protein [Calothrix sp. MO_167.B12]